MASSFARGAWSGATTAAGTPSSRATQATPCAMLPALVVHDPALEPLPWSPPDRVAGSAQLEGADWLQALELEPDLGLAFDREP